MLSTYTQLFVAVDTIRRLYFENPTAVHHVKREGLVVGKTTGSRIIH